jgi:hypothetical protein
MRKEDYVNKKDKQVKETPIIMKTRDIKSHNTEKKQEKMNNKDNKKL